MTQIPSFADRLADLARRETLPRFRNNGAIDNKSETAFDPVTDADRNAEKVMRAAIEAERPSDGIVGEEFGLRETVTGQRWVLDPVDGTRAFICGCTTWTTLIAFEKDEAPVLGVIDQPFTDERWVGFNPESFGAAGPNAYYRHGGKMTSLQTSGCTDLKDARFSTTDPRKEGYFTDNEAHAFSRIAEETRVQRFSLDAYGYALLAQGHLDLILESGLQRYDFAAPVAVIQAAGGIVTDWKGNPPGTDDSGQMLAAANGALHEQALSMLQNLG